MRSINLLLSVAILFVSQVCLGQDQLQTGKDVAVTQTTAGQVRGHIRNGIYTYKGIPYATAKRFEAPQKMEPWSAIRSSMTWGPVAPLQRPTTSVSDEIEFVFDHDWGYTSEDCLVLNVWTPNIKDERKRPVMFWIHGGGFAAGSSQELPSYHGENLAKKGDVVVVSINHRLNILGFLDLSAYGEKYKTSANNSILDMRLALEWVRDNIENFGGDPNNVTIFGQSGGGAKVNTLMAMPSAKGLFHKAINQSGAFRSNILEKPITQEIGAEVLKVLEIAPGQIDDIQSIPYMELVAAGNKALETVSNQMKERDQPVQGFGLGWGPSVDGQLLPYQVYAEEALALSIDIPLLIGTTKTEFMPSLSTGMTHASEKEVMDWLKKQYGEKTDAYVKAAKTAYPNYKMPSDLMDIDLRFRPGAIYQANIKSSQEGGASVYSYLFNWHSPVMDGKYKALHCMELAFVFDNIDRCENMTGATRSAHGLAHKVSQAWINFARFGNPNHEDLPRWPAYTEANGTNMFFDNICSIRSHHDKELMELVSER